MTSDRRSFTAVRRRLRRPAAVVLGLWFGASLAGRWGAAAVGGAVATVEMVAWWARSVDPRLFAPRFPPATTDCARTARTALDRAGHLAFARALAAVADRYVAECERGGTVAPTPERFDDR